MSLDRLSLAVTVLLALSARAAGAHHAFTPAYDAKRMVTATGVVTQFRFVNPHALLHMDVTDETGKVVEWIVEFAGQLNLREVGWTAESLKRGERVTVTGNPTHVAGPRMAFLRLTKADGTVLLPAGPQRLDAIEEERRERARRRAQPK